MKVALVLRSGGEYLPEHVRSLAEGILEHCEQAEIFCLTDCAINHPKVKEIPLMHDWPGWWSKMELFRPDIEGDFLYFDLDTVIVGDLSDIGQIKELTIMTDVYRPKTKFLQSSMMFIPADCRGEVWRDWIKSPEKHMQDCRVRNSWGDQGFLQRFWLGVQRWQDLLPGQIVSYKCHVRRKRSPRESGKGSIPEGARVVCFHGKPRPWQIQLKVPK